MEINKEFGFNGVLWHELGTQIIHKIKSFETTFNDSLNLSEYSSTVTSILFFWIIDLSDDTIHEEQISFGRKNKDIFIMHKADYQSVKDADEHTVSVILAEAYLDGIQKIEGLKIKDFDYTHFRNDVIQLFEGQGWLQLAKAS
ncbi:MAG: hypothetical protein AAF798_13105 [Bacteroidota bacterium]